MKPLVQIHDLTITFPDSGISLPALNRLSLEVAQGEMLAVVGESGSGKSVMSLALMNLLSPAARIAGGSIVFSEDGINATELIGLPDQRYRALRGNRLAMIFQEPMTSLNPLMRCGRQVAEPLMAHLKMNPKQARETVYSLFEKVNLPDPVKIYDRYPHQLSGGQKQRVMIAMAISCKPALLICDEPTTALDVRVQQTILQLLQDLRRSENMGVIFITHDLGLAADMADRAVVMLKGEVVETGMVQEIFTRPEHPYTRGLLLCRPALHPKGERLPVVADFMNGNKSPVARVAHSDPSTGKSGEQRVLIRVRDLNVRFGGQKNWLGKITQWTDAIRHINFEVFQGETLGIVGESGSGKTTLGRALLALNKPLSGSIQYDGRELLTMDRRELRDFRRNIQIVFQDPYAALNPRLTVGAAIREGISVHSGGSRTKSRLAVVEWLQKVDLKPAYYDRYPHEFSGGQRQRIVIARALALHPGFVVFDESVSALDVSVQAQVLNLINDLKRDLGFTAVFISHDLSVIRYLCDRVLVMEKGVIVESGNAEAVYSNPQSPYTRSLIDAIPGQHPGRPAG